MLHRSWLALAAFTLVTGCVTDVMVASDDPHPDVTFTETVHAMPMTGADTHAAAAIVPAVTGAHLTYYGGKVIQNTSVVEVLYGAGSAPAWICAASSAWMFASVIVAPLRALVGAIWTFAAKPPRPITCAGDAVLYSLSQSNTPLDIACW